MAQFFPVTIAMVCLSVASLSPAALPQAPAETPAAQAFRLAGFTISGGGGCRLPSINIKAGPNVGDAQLKSLLDPGYAFVLDLSKSHVTDAGIREVVKFSKMYQINLCGSATTLTCVKDLTAFKYLAVYLDSSQVTAESAQALAKSSASNCVLLVDGMNDAAFHALAEAHLVHLLAAAMGSKSPGRAETDEHIVSLALQSAQISDTAMKDVATLRGLKSLSLGGSAVTDAGLGELTGLRHLSQIDLNFTKVTDAGIRELAKLENLKSLDLCQTKVTGAGLKYLAHHADLSLTLDDSAINVENLQKIAQAGIPAWTLVFTYSDESLHALRQAGMLHLMGSATAQNGGRPRSDDEVTSFKLRGRQLTDEGFKELAAFKHLQTLDLRSTGIDDAGLASLAGLENLTTMDLSRTLLTDAGLKLLAARKNLTSLNVSGKSITDAGIAELKLTLPHCVINH